MNVEVTLRPRCQPTPASHTSQRPRRGRSGPVLSSGLLSGECFTTTQRGRRPYRRDRRRDRPPRYEAPPARRLTPSTRPPTWATAKASPKTGIVQALDGWPYPPGGFLVEELGADANARDQTTATGSSRRRCGRRHDAPRYEEGIAAARRRAGLCVRNQRRHQSSVTRSTRTD